MQFYTRPVRRSVGSVILLGIAAFALLPFTDAEVRESFRRTGEILERELPGHEPFVIRVEVPSDDHMEVGNLLYAVDDSGRQEVVGELIAIESREGGHELSFRLLPEGAGLVRTGSPLEVIYPPRSFDEHAYLMFPAEFQEELKDRLYQRSAVLLQELKPYAYQKLGALTRAPEGGESQLYNWVRTVQERTMPSRDEVSEFARDDLYPHLRTEFDEPLDELLDELVDDFHAQFGVWGKTKLVWNVLLNDSDTLKAKLEPVVSETVGKFFHENKEDLIDRLGEVWKHYQPELLDYFKEEVGPAALAVFEEDAGPVLVEQVILPLLDEQRDILLEAAKQEVIWSYEESVFSDSGLFHHRFVYLARNQAFKKQEARFVVHPTLEGEPLESGATVPATIYFPPESPAMTVTVAAEEVAR